MPDAFSASKDLPPTLGHLLYRFDCPAPHTLGDYQLELLDPEQRSNVASHAADCEECASELGILRAFLAVDPHVPETLGQRVRRVLATLIAPAPGLALQGLRGTADAATLQFEAEDVSITVALGRGDVVGLVTGSAPASSARVLDGDAVVGQAPVDELGNFEVDGIAPGVYALELSFDDRVVVLEKLQID